MGQKEGRGTSQYGNRLTTLLKTITMDNLWNYCSLKSTLHMLCAKNEFERQRWWKMRQSSRFVFSVLSGVSPSDKTTVNKQKSVAHLKLLTSCRLLEIELLISLSRFSRSDPSLPIRLIARSVFSSSTFTVRERRKERISGLHL